MTTLLFQEINNVLPQTQCTQCGYSGCEPYAKAIAFDNAPINQCPPGGQAGIAQLAALTGKPIEPLNPHNGFEQPRQIALIDESQCIGCTKCIQACPVDAIIGASKLMHTVIADLCTGCGLCVPPCPVDCIEMPLASDVGQTDDWSPDQAQLAKQRFERRNQRLIREAQDVEKARLAKLLHKQVELSQTETNPNITAEQLELDRKKSIVEAALARARARRPQ